MFLSGGVGFQSTKLIAKSVTLGANTSTASVFFPAFTNFVTSNSWMWYAPATSFASANCLPLIQMFARQLIPSKCSANCLFAFAGGTVNSVRYHQGTAYGLPS